MDSKLACPLWRIETINYGYWCTNLCLNESLDLATITSEIKVSNYSELLWIYN